MEGGECVCVCVLSLFRIQFHCNNNCSRFVFWRVYLQSHLVVSHAHRNKMQDSKDHARMILNRRIVVHTPTLALKAENIPGIHPALSSFLLRSASASAPFLISFSSKSYFSAPPSLSPLLLPPIPAIRIFR